MPKGGIARAISCFTTPEIKKLLYQGRPVYTSAELDIRALAIKQPFAKILIVTPKKIGSAPARNLLKRRLKAIFYEEKLYQRPYNLAALCRKGSPQLSFDELKTILLNCYQTLKTE